MKEKIRDMAIMGAVTVTIFGFAMYLRASDIYNRVEQKLTKNPLKD